MTPADDLAAAQHRLAVVAKALLREAEEVGLWWHIAIAAGFFIGAFLVQVYP